MSDFDLMSGFDKGRDSLGDTAPLTTSTTTQPPSEGSNRDSLNLDDFEKVEADQLFGAPTSTVSSGVGNVAESTQAAAVGLVDDVMAQVKNSGQDLFSNFTSTGIPSASETKKKDVSPMPDPFKIEADFGKDTNVSFAPSDMFSSDLISSSDDKTGGSGLDVGFTGIPASESFTSDLLASAPPPPSTNLFDDFSPKHDEKPFDDFMSKSDDKGMSSFDDFKSKSDDKGMSSFDDFKSKSDDKDMSSFDDFKSKSDDKGKSSFDDFKSKSDDKGKSSLDDFMSKSDDKGMHDFSIPDIKEAVKNVADPVFDSFSAFSSQPPLLADPSPVEPVKRDPSPDLRNPTPPRTPTAPVPVLASPKQPTPPRTPTPPPREPTPPIFKETTLPPKQPTPPRTPTPPPREPTPPPKEPTPPPKEPTPPPKVPTPPPREPTPPPREPTPPPREPTPPPREPTPPPKEPTPPPRKPTPPREPTPPPRTPTPPPLLVKATPSAPLQEPTVSPGRSYAVSASTKNAFNVFKPRAWFNPDQLDPRVVDLIYWRDVKKTGVVFGSLMVILLSLAYLSLISVVAYTSLALLTGTITFRVYKNIMQAVQKSQDGHPFKCILEMDTDLPSEKVHEATDVIVSQINSTISELKRLFLVEDLVDSVKFGCLLWCLTYLGSWFNGLTLVILAVVALFSLPKVYEQNQTQIDQYVGLVRSQVNDVMSKVKAALPIGNKEKAQ